MQQVLVCRTCGHINPIGDSERCDECWLPLTGAITMDQDEAEKMRGSRWPRFLQRRVLITSIALVFGLITWQLVVIFDVMPRVFPPAKASGDAIPSLAPGDWGQAGRTAESSRFTPDAAPKPSQIKWTFPTFSPLVASPSVVDGRVYLTTDDGRLVVLDAESGNPVWEFVSGARSSSSPAIVGDLVIFAVRTGLVIALDRVTGEQVWEVDLMSPIYASPVVGDGTVFIGSGASMLFAIDALTGEMRWASPTRDWVIAPAAYAGDTVVVASQGRVVDIFDANNGRRRLKYDTGKVRFGGAPAIQGDLAYFSSDGGLVWAIDRKSQTYPMERFIFRVKLNLYVWQMISGRPVQRGGTWSKRVGGNINLPLAVTPDAVYGAKEDGIVFSRDSKTGKEIWSTGVGSEVGVAPTVAGETLLVGLEDGNVVGIDTPTGKILWAFPVGAEITGSPIVAGNTIYVGAADGRLYAITGDAG